ncbi:MAG TPA: pilus assembly protein TadG-related protein [Actinomycetota bacterium]|nr:pilus assembly protein TadG-related protein [Actinomycetota bacterium]
MTASRNDESGATMVIVAVSLFAIMGLAVLVVDVGGLLTLRRQLVTASDAAALAGAQSCAGAHPEQAQAQADLLATQNQSDSTRQTYTAAGCGAASSGSVHVKYVAPKALTFAPLLGYPEERDVSASATAIWGPSGGDTPMPIEFAIDPAGLIPCAFQEVGTRCDYWWDNSSDHDLTNDSNWGFMNLATAGVSADANCPNSGTDDRRDWIVGGASAPIDIPADGFTYVCVDSGHSNSSWFAALQDQVGKIKHFPVNDPAHMIRDSGKEKYAIVGFVALRVEAVLRGNDPAAVGTPGQSGTCSVTHSFSPHSTFDLDAAGCTADADEISDLVLTNKTKNRTISYQAGVDYYFDPVSHVITWSTGNAPDVTVNFSWAKAGAEGACGNRDPDPNAVCLVASWQGLQIGGSAPGNGRDFGLRSVRLSE